MLPSIFIVPFIAVVLAIFVCQCYWGLKMLLLEVVKGFKNDLLPVLQLGVLSVALPIAMTVQLYQVWKQLKEQKANERDDLPLP